MLLAGHVPHHTKMWSVNCGPLGNGEAHGLEPVGFGVCDAVYRAKPLRIVLDLVLGVDDVFIRFRFG